MLNDSLVDTLAITDSIFDVESKDFIVMAKVAVKWLFHSGGSFNGFTQDESSFIKALQSRDELGLFWTAFTDIKFAEAKGFICHKMAIKMHNALTKSSREGNQDEFEDLESSALSLLDSIITLSDGISLDMMRHELELIDKDDMLDSE